MPPALHVSVYGEEFVAIPDTVYEHELIAIPLLAATAANAFHSAAVRDGMK